MNKCVLIFAKTNYSKTPYDQWLRDANITPLILTSDEYFESYKHIPNVFAFKNYDLNQMVQKKALELARTNNIISVFARAEADILRAAQLRELLSIPGQYNQSALAYRNKIIMKDHLKNSSVKLPQYRPLSSAYEVIHFVQQFGYPVVIKPVAESGSFGTQIIHSEKELDRFLETTSVQNMEIETFIEGQMYHVDGLLRNGEVVFIQPSQYINDCLSFRNDEYCGSVTVSPSESIHQALVDTTLQVVKKLPSPLNMVFHCELWVRADDEIVFCEIASRTGGAIISSIIEKTFNINLDKEWFLAECGLTSNNKPNKYKAGGGVWIPPLKGILKSLPKKNHPHSIVASQINGQIDQTYHGGVKSGLFLAGYVVSGDSELEIVENVRQTASWFADESVWEMTK